MIRHTRTMRWLSRQGRRISVLAVGYTTKRLEEYLFDWLLYGTVVAWATAKYGAVWGYLYAFLIMTPLSALLCYSYIRFYDWTQKDWFGFELIKETRDSKSHKGYFMRIAHRIAAYGDVPAFIALSIYGDPFLTTIYLRKSKKAYHGLSRWDWTVFWSSVILSNAYWTLRWTILVEIFFVLWRSIAS